MLPITMLIIRPIFQQSGFLGWHTSCPRALVKRWPTRGLRDASSTSQANLMRIHAMIAVRTMRPQSVQCTTTSCHRACREGVRASRRDILRDFLLSSALSPHHLVENARCSLRRPRSPRRKRSGSRLPCRRQHDGSRRRRSARPAGCAPYVRATDEKMLTSHFQDGESTSKHR